MDNAKIALVTGGSRGLGRAMALHLARHRRDIILTYRSAQAEADAVVREIEGFGRKALALRLDVSDSSTFEAFAKDVAARLAETWQRSHFDFLVNHAGIGIHAAFLQTTEAQLDELFRIHLKGPFVLTQKLAPLIADGGRILNVSTGLARFTLPGYAAYAAMKGGVEVLTRYMAKELGARRIGVNTIAPGAIETDFAGGVVRDNANMNAAIASQTALGRVGLPDDIGEAVSMLLSDEAHWISGQRVEVSGGMFL